MKTIKSFRKKDNFDRLIKQAKGELFCARISIIGRNAFQCFFTLMDKNNALSIGGEVAQTVYNKFETEEIQEDGYTIIKKKLGTLSCAKRDGLRENQIYWCVLENN